MRRCFHFRWTGGEWILVPMGGGCHAEAPYAVPSSALGFETRSRTVALRVHCHCDCGLGLYRLECRPMRICRIRLFGRLSIRTPFSSSVQLLRTGVYAQTPLDEIGE